MTRMRDYPQPVDGLIVDHDGAVLRLRFDRVARRNALTDQIVLAMIDLIEVAGSDPDVRVIHISGEGDHFCSGFDLSLRGAPESRPRAGATQRQMRWHVNRLIPAMLETQAPIVTTVRGWVIGLGMNIALASDFVVAADDARFWAPFTGAAFTPDSGSSWLIPRLAGVARAKEMIMLGTKIDGRTAADWGMIHRAVPADQVEATTDELLGKLAGAATVAVGLSKLLIHRAMTQEIGQHLVDEGFSIELSSRSEDFKEASRAGREKRPPTFDGR